MSLLKKSDVGSGDGLFLSVLWFAAFFSFLALLIVAAQPVVIALVLGFNLIVIRDRLGVKLNGLYRATFIVGICLFFAGYLVMTDFRELALEYASMSEDMSFLLERYSAQLSSTLPVFGEYIPAAVSDLSDNYAEYLQGLVSAESVSVFATFLFCISLLPVLVFMFFTEHAKILPSVYSFIPKEASYTKTVLAEWLGELEEYVWCKNIEALIMTAVSFVLLEWVVGLNYSFVLAILMGLSVFIPFVGPLLAAIPVFAVSLIQFGATGTTMGVMAYYAVLQALEGFVLTPWLFGRRLELSPLAVLTFIVLLGSLFGFWGVLLTVPLLTFVRACQVCGGGVYRQC
ncbi:AI-2E family transporter [Vibrio owensii]|uniref:AI-2E family transporter n=1 Tax=Vibrio owensii TaxID=696485 RepID=UPI001A7ECA4C|nr:AI-2E family transporter [Vibrio owensii]